MFVAYVYCPSLLSMRCRYELTDKLAISYISCDVFCYSSHKHMKIRKTLIGAIITTLNHLFYILKYNKHLGIIEHDTIALAHGS